METPAHKEQTFWNKRRTHREMGVLVLIGGVLLTAVFVVRPMIHLSQNQPAAIVPKGVLMSPVLLLTGLFLVSFGPLMQPGRLASRVRAAWLLMAIVAVLIVGGIAGGALLRWLGQKTAPPPNKSAAPNAGIASQLAFDHHWPCVGEPGRSPDT